MLFIHSYVHGHWSFFHFLAIMNNAAVNMGFLGPYFRFFWVRLYKWNCWIRWHF